MPTKWTAPAPNVTVWKEISISCAHMIPNHPGKCKNLHGHNYRIQVGVSGPVNKQTGMVKDFYEIKADLAAVIDGPCDHRYLNDVYPEMLTTAENLAGMWLIQLRALDPRYYAVRVYETDTCWAEARAY